MIARKKGPKVRMIIISRSIVILSMAPFMGSMESKIMGKTKADKARMIAGKASIYMLMGSRMIVLASYFSNDIYLRILLPLTALSLNFGQTTNLEQYSGQYQKVQASDDDHTWLILSRHSGSNKMICSMGG